jgi:serine protease
VVAAAAGLPVLSLASTAQALPASHIAGTPAIATHSYRHGLVPMRGAAGARYAPRATCSSKCLHFRGGIDGVGVTTGKEAVYLVFWGSQWGTPGTNSKGDTTYSGDKSSVAPLLQEFFKGLGGGGELWSGVMTQYCQGVAIGATRCPSTAAHVAYPTGGALAGIWEDTSTASPAQSSGHQLAVEAEAAATHFGNTTTASNRDTQYVIVSPTGTNPDNYKGNGFCAWHDYTGDGTLDGGGGATGPLIAFTNLPYIPDAGANCGAGFVNPGNPLDGVTIVEGHEYAETITDQYPAGGWTANNGEETGDLCAWKTSGSGRVQNVTFGTGSYAVQGTWSNAANKGLGACAVKHAIVT